MNRYEKRLKQRFAELAADRAWSVVARLVADDSRDEDEYWFSDLERMCLELSARLGLAVGPASCTWCEQPWPELGDVPDDGPCPACQQKEAD